VELPLSRFSRLLATPVRALVAHISARVLVDNRPVGHLEGGSRPVHNAAAIVVLDDEGIIQGPGPAAATGENTATDEIICADSIVCDGRPDDHCGSALHADQLTAAGLLCLVAGLVGAREP